MLVLGYVGGLLAVLALVVYCKRKRVNMSALSIGVDFLQVVSVFTSFGFEWPAQLSGIFVVASSSTLNDQLLAPECSVQGTRPAVLAACRGVQCPVSSVSLLGLRNGWCFAEAFAVSSVSWGAVSGVTLFWTV